MSALVWTVSRQEQTGQQDLLANPEKARHNGFKVFFSPITDIATYRLNQPRGQVIWNA